MYFEITLLLCAVLATFVLFFWTFCNGIGPVPTGWKARKALVPLLPERISGDILELGCGWGDVAVLLARHYPDNQIIAFETSPLPWLVSWVRALRYRNLSVVYRDFMKASFNDAGLIYCYLYRKGMERLEKKWVDEVERDSILISYTFRFPSCKAHQSKAVADIYRSVLYFYQTSRKILPNSTSSAKADTQL